MEDMTLNFDGFQIILLFVSVLLVCIHPLVAVDVLVLTE